MKFDIRIVVESKNYTSEEKIARMMEYAIKHLGIIYQGSGFTLRLQKCKFQKTLRRKQLRKEN